MTNTSGITYFIAATVESYAPDVLSVMIVEEIYAPLVDPIITPEPSSYQAMVNDPLFMTIQSIPPFEEVDSLGISNSDYFGKYGNEPVGDHKRVPVPYAHMRYQLFQMPYLSYFSRLIILMSFSMYYFQHAFLGGTISRSMML